jgi:hypothetical protein
MAKFKIYGDYGYTTETLLEEFDTRSEAVRWAEGYVESGDFGGYDVIEVARFADDGEYIVVMKYRREDYEDFYEGDDDFALIDEF